MIIKNCNEEFRYPITFSKNFIYYCFLEKFVWFYWKTFLFQRF